MTLPANVADALAMRLEELEADNTRLRARVALQNRMLHRFRERLHSITETGVGPLARIAAHVERVRQLATFTIDDNMDLVRDGNE